MMIQYLRGEIYIDLNRQMCFVYVSKVVFIFKTERCTIASLQVAVEKNKT